MNVGYWNILRLCGCFLKCDSSCIWCTKTSCRTGLIFFRYAHDYDQDSKICLIRGHFAPTYFQPPAILKISVKNVTCIAYANKILQHLQEIMHPVLPIVAGD